MAFPRVLSVAAAGIFEKEPASALSVGVTEKKHTWVN